MKNPLITVVMSVYNSEKYLDEAIQSILNQTFNDFEFIIINDGSTDNSLNIIKKYIRLDKRIVLISRENKGLIASLNEGIQQSKGKYIARMDADDISMPTRFEDQVEFMENNTHIGVCGTAVIGFGDGIKKSIWKLSSNDSTLKTELLFSSIFAHPSIFLRKELITKYSLYYNHKFLHAEDYELWSRMANHTQFYNLKKPLIKYRISKNSATRNADKNISTRYETIKSIFEKYLIELDIQNSEEENILHFNLSVNNRIRDNVIIFEVLDRYFNKLLKANTNKKVFKDSELKKILGKKWLWNLYYHKELSGIFSFYFLYGLWGFVSK